jgi:predicted transcriptional regulator
MKFNLKLFNYSSLIKPAVSGPMFDKVDYSAINAMIGSINKIQNEVRS